MSKNDAISQLQAEFRLWGIQYTTRERGSGHIEIVWQVNQYKSVRSYIISKTPSDSRGALNARADIRRMFRADGLALKEQPKAPKLHVALSLPKPTDPLPDQVALLRAEVGDLTELLLDLTGTIAAIRDHIITQTFTPPKTSYRKTKIIDFVKSDWQSTAVIAVDASLPESVTYSKLQYLKEHGHVELDNGCWRRKHNLHIIDGGFPNE